MRSSSYNGTVATVHVCYHYNEANKSMGDEGRLCDKDEFSPFNCPYIKAGIVESGVGR